MSQSKSHHFRAAALGLLLVGCGGSNVAPPGKPFGVVLRATSDEGEPVQGVTFRHGLTAFGTTNAKGVVSTTIRAEEGQTVPVDATCPDGYVAPEKSTPLRLAEVRRIDPAAPASLSVEVICTRKLRDVVLLVRTGQGTGISVEVAGQKMGQTDGNGNAHIAMQLDREQRTVSVGLGTSGLLQLRPQNPSRVFDLGGEDALLLFHQNFTDARPAPVKRRIVAKKAAPPAPEKHVPYRIDSGRSHAF